MMNSKTPFSTVYDPANMTITAEDLKVFSQYVRDFLPSGIIDFHTHCYDLNMLGGTVLHGNGWVGVKEIHEHFTGWMGDLAPNRLLIFPFPLAGLDRDCSNDIMFEDLKRHPGSRGLLIISPDDDPSGIEELLDHPCIAGFKVYPCFTGRDNVNESLPEEFIPPWAWELAQAYGKIIMLHLVLPRGLSEERNWKYVRQQCRRYPDALLVLAHGGRGFSPRHTDEVLGYLKNLDNLFFDTSVVCEEGTFRNILSSCGPSRLLYGSDFPVSTRRGRIIALGDGFYPLYDGSIPAAVLLGLESLLALVPALDDSVREQVFRGNAERLLGAEDTRTQDGVAHV